jgi:6-phosphofructokinase
MSQAAKRLGVLTSGGDCPGLNAVIRGVVKAAGQLGSAASSRQPASLGTNAWGFSKVMRGSSTR